MNSNQITLLLPADTPLPVVGGICRRAEADWVQTSSKRYYRKKSGAIEATYDLDTLRFAIGTIEASDKCRQAREAAVISL